MKYTLFCTASLAAASLAAGTVIYDFETPEEIAKAPKITQESFRVGVTNAFATSGNKALLFSCAKWKKGYPQWPSLDIRPKVTDWTGYDRLVVDIVSTGDGGDLLSVFIAGPKGRVQDGLLRNSRVPGCGVSQWVITLNEWPEKTSPANVGRVHFFTAHPQGFNIAIDRLTLLKKGEQPLPPSKQCLGRDVLPAVLADRENLKLKIQEMEEWKTHVDDALRFRHDCTTSGSLKSGAMFLGTATSMEQVRPRGPFKAKPMPAAGLSLRLAGNEYESVQLLVMPRDGDLSGVKVTLGPEGLKGPGGSVFPAKNVECDVTGYVRTIRCPPYAVGYNVPTNTPAGYTRLKRQAEIGWWPDPILGFLDGVDVKGDDVQSFWIRVKCPEGQKPGTYRGTLVVSAKGAATVRVPFSVRVNAFTLGRVSALPVAITFSPAPNTQHESIDNLKAAAARRADPDSPVNAWRRHESEWVSFLADYLIPMDSLYHSSDMWRLRALKQLKEEGRIAPFNLGYWTYPAKGESMESWRKRTIPRLKKYYEGAKELGIEKYAYVYGCDEIAAEFFPLIRKAVNELKAALPGVPVSTTAYDHDFGVGTQLDVMDCFTPRTEKYDFAKAEASRKAGHRVWWYICCGPHAPYANMFIECPVIESRLLMGAQSVRMRPDAFLYYQTTLWNSKRCIESGPFTDWDPRSWTSYHGDGAWTCVGPDGRPVPTVRLENFRDGLEDYAYAKLLEKKLSERKGAAAEDGWSRRARELLAVPVSVMDTMTNYTDDPSAVYAWRDAIADLIETSGKKQ